MDVTSIEAWLAAPEVRAWCLAHGLNPAHVLALLPYPGSDGGRYTMVEYEGPDGRESHTLSSWPPTGGWPARAVEGVAQLRRNQRELAQLLAKMRGGTMGRPPAEGG